VPGPTDYKANKNVVKSRVTAVKIAPSKGKKNKWKLIKSDEPDCGTYEVEKSRK